MLISPSGKCYVGQTKHEVMKRWRQHINEANYKQDHSCRALNNAIKKYGPDDFQVITLIECDDSELNDEEIRLIEEKETLYPNGYNLTRGGQNGCVYYSEELRQKISDNHRKFTHDDFELPRYVRYLCEEKKEGFRVNIPNKKAYLFTASNLTICEKYNLAMEKFEEIQQGIDDAEENRRKKCEESAELPKYISYIAKREGYEVRKPGSKRKWFSSKKLSKEEKLAQAKEYLESLN